MPHKSTIEPAFDKRKRRWYNWIPSDVRHLVGVTRRYYASEPDAQDDARMIQAMRGSGTRAEMLRRSDRDIALLLEAEAVLGGAAAVLDAAKFWKAQKPGEVSTLKQLAVLCVADREAAKYSPAYCNELRLHLQAFIRGREGMLAHEVQSHHVKDWVYANLHESQFTKQTRLRNVRTMFEYGVSHKHVSKNPADDVTAPTIPDVSPVIFTPDECERLMRTAEREMPALVPFVSLCLFGGLRPEAEAIKIFPAAIRENHVEVFGKRVKKRNRRLVTLNDTLRAWLARYPVQEEPITDHLRKMRRLRAATAVGEFGPIEPLRWHQDILRHSFVSYHCAIHGVKQTALEAGHSEAVLFQHYREIVTKAEAERFWGILPIA